MKYMGKTDCSLVWNIFGEFTLVRGRELVARLPGARVKNEEAPGCGA